MYYVYMLRCVDHTIYTGITTNIERRMQEHFTKNDKCSKYTFHHTATRLESVWKTENRSLASKLEYHIKKLTKDKKESLIRDPSLLKVLLGDKIEEKKYEVIKIK